MQRCPCCKARLAKASLCPRCQADLGHVIDSEQAAQFWLSKAILYWQEGDVAQSVSALELALHHNKTELAVIFREYLIHQQSQEVVEQLAQKQPLMAKQKLNQIHLLIPYSKLLQQLQRFTDYLLVENQSVISPYQDLRRIFVGISDIAKRIADYVTTATKQKMDNKTNSGLLSSLQEINKL